MQRITIVSPDDFHDRFNMWITAAGNPVNIDRAMMPCNDFEMVEAIHSASTLKLTALLKDRGFRVLVSDLKEITPGFANFIHQYGIEAESSCGNNDVSIEIKKVYESTI